MIIHTKKNPKISKADIRIAHVTRTHEMIIHTKFQLPSLKTVACYRVQTRIPFGKYIVRSEGLLYRTHFIAQEVSLGHV